MVLRQLVSSLINNLGFEVRRKNSGLSLRGHYSLGYDLEQEAYESMIKVHTHTMLSYQRLVTLYQQVIFCEEHDIRGSFVECGTWKGGAVGLMALGNLSHSSTRRHIHLFDSFEGLPEPDRSIDGAKAVAEALKAGGGTSGQLIALPWLVGPLETNKELLEQTIGYDPGHLHYHKGWFQETVPKDAAEVGPIAILRLDGDWYASTKVCLEHLYDLVVSGGFVIIDDYGCFEGCQKATDEFLNKRGIRAYLNHIDSTGRYLIKP
jgi:hypothetical protein